MGLGEGLGMAATQGQKAKTHASRDSKSEENGASYKSTPSKPLNAISNKKRRAKNLLRRRATNPKDLVPESDKDIQIEDFPRAAAELSLRDIRLVARQLGYLPLNIVKVGAYNTLKQTVGGNRQIDVCNPTVSVLYPLSLSKPERHNRDPDTMSIRKSYNKAVPAACDATANTGAVTVSPSTRAAVPSVPGDELEHEKKEEDQESRKDGEDDEDDEDDESSPLAVSLEKLGDRPPLKIKARHAEAAVPPTPPQVASSAMPPVPESAFSVNQASTPASQKKAKICFRFGTPKGCRFGNACTFRHVVAGSVSATESTTEKIALDSLSIAASVTVADPGDSMPAISQESPGPNKTKRDRKWLPFPTTLWMTCPVLHERVCKLEEQGWISRLEARLNTSDDTNAENEKTYLTQMAAAHEAYQDYRWSLLSAADKEYVVENKWEGQLYRGVGIAGIRHFDSVKCLHAHYSHYLARPQDNNIIGMWVQELLDDEPDEKEEL
eukprot:GSChrysophyteH1.ASY1.ANO1.2658.1 assembled CDS